MRSGLPFVVDIYIFGRNKATTAIDINRSDTRRGVSNSR